MKSKDFFTPNSGLFILYHIKWFIMVCLSDRFTLGRLFMKLLLCHLMSVLNRKCWGFQQPRFLVAVKSIAAWILLVHHQQGSPLDLPVRSHCLLCFGSTSIAWDHLAHQSWAQDKQSVKILVAWGKSGPRRIPGVRWIACWAVSWMWLTTC